MIWHQQAGGTTPRSTYASNGTTWKQLSMGAGR